MRGGFLLSLQLSHCLKRGCHIPGIDISLILSLTEMNRILASVEHFMQPHEYCAQCCISYGVTENRVLHFISGCETSANKCWPCTTNVLREASSTMNAWYPLWAHLPLGNHLFPICTSCWYKERAPVLLKKPFSWPVLYLPRTALLCKAIDTMKSIFMNPEHKAWPTPPAQRTACSVFTLLSCIVSGQPPADRSFLKDRAFFFLCRQCPSLQPPREWEWISCQRWGKKSLHSSKESGVG